VSRVALVVSLACGILPQLAHAGGKVIERIVAVVNDDIIMETEVEQWSAPQMRQGVDPESAEGKKAWEDAKRKGLDQLIDSKLLAQQATELKLTVTNDEIDRAADSVREQNKLDEATFREALKQQGFTMESYRKTLKRQLLELKVLNTAVRSRVSVSDDEVKTFYQQNVAQLGNKEVHLRQILIGVPSGASQDDVARKLRVAQKLVEAARAHKSFVELAKANSDDELTREEGGDLGWIGPGVLQDELDRVVATMGPGDVRGPIRTARGWNILQVVERKSDAKPFEDAKEEIRKRLYDEQVEKATNAWLKELRKKAHVETRL
jgi:peptidyl-prolyl cis-trans isomerase SurA